jgi:hypothetical protein
MNFINNLFLSILSLIKVLIKSKINLVSPPKTNKSRIYILGNGPSFRQSLEKKISELSNPNNAVMVVNGFVCSDEFIEIRPEYYLFLDPLFSNYDGNAENCTIKVISDTYQHLVEKVDWQMHLLVPATAMKNHYFKTIPQKNPHIKISFYNYVVASGFESISFWLYKKQLAMPQCQNVLGACIMNAINMQFKEIILLGADHSWHEQISINDNNEVEVLDKHFYNPKGLKINQAHRSNDHKKYGIHTFFMSISKAFLTYKNIATYAIYRNVKVINSSEKSYIDAFERLNN